MTPDTTRRYLIAYDIADDRRRDRIAKYLLRHGDRVQYSVFVCDTKPARFVRLRSGLIPLLEEAEDSVLICCLGPLGAISDARFEFLGYERYVTPDRAVIV